MYEVGRLLEKGEGSAAVVHRWASDKGRGVMTSQRHSAPAVRSALPGLAFSIFTQPRRDGNAKQRKARRARRAEWSAAWLRSLRARVLSVPILRVLRVPDQGKEGPKDSPGGLA